MASKVPPATSRPELPSPGSNGHQLQGFALAMKGKLRDAVVDRLDKNEKMATRYLNEDDFQNVAFNELVRRIYEDLKKTG